MDSQAGRAWNRAREYRNTKLKLYNTKLKIWFNKQCLNHNVTPNYARIKNKPSSRAAKKAISTAQKSWVQFEIKDLHAQKEMLNSKLFHSHLAAANDMSSDDWQSVSNKIHAEVMKANKTRKQNLQIKLDKLIDTQSVKQPVVSSHKFNDRVKNLSDTVFTEKETEQLEFGLKQNYHSSFNDTTIKRLITEVETAVTHLPITVQQIIKHEATDKIQQCVKKQNNQAKSKFSKNSSNHLKTVKRKIRDNNLVVSKADKGNTVVIMDRTEYIEKTEDFLKSGNTIKLKKDPTSKYNTHLKQALKDTNFILTKNEKNKLINMNPAIPTLKALPKIHKLNTPIRPVVNCRNAPTYHLAKFLHKHISQHFSFQDNRSVKNTSDLIKNLNKIEVKENSRLVTFDVENMFTNIPTQETITIIENNLTEKSILSSIEINETIRLLRLTLKQNYFIFNGTVYSQEQGLGMGSPLSGLLAEIFMNDLESKFFNNDTMKDKIPFWNRYVDDTLAIINIDNTTTDEVEDIINLLHPNIKFTSELEENNEINFLDVTVKRNNSNLTFNIFRKSTHTSHTINNFSNHPATHKKAAFQSMINRAIKLPLNTDNFKNELTTLKFIAKENNFNTKMIDTMIHKTQHKLNSNQNRINQENETRERFAIFTYINQDIHKITNIFKKHNVKTSFRTNNKLSNHISNNTLDMPEPFTQPGVYKLTCQEQNCMSSYVGMTARNFNVRYKEHVRAFTGCSYSAFAEHMQNTGHQFTTIAQDLTILHKQKKSKALGYLEQIEIQIDLANSKQNLNEYGILPRSILHSLL